MRTKKAIGSSSINLDTRVYPAEKYSCYARNLCGNNNAEARC